MRTTVPLAILVVASLGCSTVEVTDDTDGALLDEAPPAAPAETCRVPIPDGVVALVASDHGLAVASASPGPHGDELAVRRMRGAGCSLDDDGPAYAAAALFDLDDEGNLYLLPDDAGAAPGVVSTVLPGSYRAAQLARLDGAGRIQEILPAARGIWSFGLAPGGDALWITACGPTGIFAVDGDVATPSLTPPDTQWPWTPAVLTDAGTLWSLGHEGCDDEEPTATGCGRALTRTTAASSEELAPTVVDLGHGPESATLARCGSRVCGVFGSAIVVWGADGAVEQTVAATDAHAAADERIAGASGSSLGLYVLLHGDAGSRVVFVPWR